MAHVKPNRVFLPTLAATGLVLLAKLVHAWQTEFTPEFFKIGSAWLGIIAFMFALLIVPAGAMFGGVLWWLNRRGWLPRCINGKLILAAGMGLVLWGAVAGFIGSNPKAMYARQVGVAEDRVSEVSVVGFSSFLSQQWLVAFRVSAADAAVIAEKLELKEDGEVDLKQTLSRDLSFSQADSPVLKGIPEAKSLRGYSWRHAPELGATHWIQLAVDEENGRAWILRGSQN